MVPIPFQATPSLGREGVFAFLDNLAQDNYCQIELDILLEGDGMAGTEKRKNMPVTLTGDRIVEVDICRAMLAATGIPVEELTGQKGAEPRPCKRLWRT